MPPELVAVVEAQLGLRDDATSAAALLADTGRAAAHSLVGLRRPADDQPAHRDELAVLEQSEQSTDDGAVLALADVETFADHIGHGLQPTAVDATGGFDLVLVDVSENQVLELQAHSVMPLPVKDRASRTRVGTTRITTIATFAIYVL